MLEEGSRLLVKYPRCLVLLPLILLSLFPIQISIAESTQKPDLSGVTTNESKAIEDVCAPKWRYMGPATSVYVLHCYELKPTLFMGILI